MSTDFEKIVAGQLPSHLEAWYELELDEAYEHIEPQSAVGGIAVALYDTLFDSEDKKRTTTRRYRSELDLMIHADDIEDADHALELAEARHKVFQGMYIDIEGVLGATVLGYAPRGGYQGTVNGALKRGIEELDKVWIPLGSKSELIMLNQELAAFFSLESDLHFQALA